MVSTARVKSGGAWRGPIADGVVNVKSGGAWKSPAYMYAKRGGVWVDTGYRGFPNPPRNFTIYGNGGFSSISLTWSAPAAGGAPATSYQVAIRDSNGNLISGRPDVDDVQAPWSSFAVGEDWVVQLYVRSKSAAGLYSGWVGPIKYAIGHTETGYNETRYATQGWTSYTNNNVAAYRWRNDPFWQNVPTNVAIGGMHWRNLRIPAGSWVSPSLTASDRIVAVFISTPGYQGDYGAIHDGRYLDRVPSGDNWDKAASGTSSGSVWGIVPRGTGWSTPASQGGSNDTNNALWCDSFWLSGIETYAYNVYVQTRARVENYYW